MLEKINQNNITERVGEIQSIVLQSVNLIKLFEDKGYIFTFVSIGHKLPNQMSWGKYIMQHPSQKIQFPDPAISYLFTEYAKKEIFVTPELRKFIEDGFISREQKQAKHQFNLTIALLAISILAFLLNLGFNLYEKFFSN